MSDRERELVMLALNAALLKATGEVTVENYIHAPGGARIYEDTLMFDIRSAARDAFEEELAALARQDAEECSECGGKGTVIEYRSAPGNMVGLSFSHRACPKCAPKKLTEIIKAHAPPAEDTDAALARKDGEAIAEGIELRTLKCEKCAENLDLCKCPSPAPQEPECETCAGSGEVKERCSCLGCEPGFCEYHETCNCWCHPKNKRKRGTKPCPNCSGEECGKCNGTRKVDAFLGSKHIGKAPCPWCAGEEDQ